MIGLLNTVILQRFYTYILFIKNGLDITLPLDSGKLIPHDYSNEQIFSHLHQEQ